MSSDPGETFERRFRRALRRLERRSAIDAAARILPWLEAAWLAAFLFGRAGWSVVPEPLVAAVLATLLAAGVGLRLWRTPSGVDAALVLDRRLGTRELVTAAVETADRGGEPRPLIAMARRRAADALASPAVAAALPFAGWRGWRPAILGAAAVALAFFLPLRPPGSVAAAEAVDPVVEKTAEALARELEPLAETFAEAERPEAAEALEQLRQLIDEMREGEIETAEDALVAISRLEQTFRELAEETAGGPAGFDDLVSDLGAEPLSADLATAMTAGDREAMSEALRRMGEAMSAPEARGQAMERQMELLKERLEELARLLEMSRESELAAAVRELLEALEAGDLERARELLESAEMGKACKSAGERAAGEGLNGQLAEMLGFGRYLLGLSPQALGAGAAATSASRGPGRGSHPGTATTRLEAEGYTTGDPILRDRQTGDTADWQVDFESMWSSRLERAAGEDLRLEGATGESGELKSLTGRGLGVRGEGSLPLAPLAASSAADAERAADFENLPLGYRDLVRRYFQRRETSAEAPPSAGAEQGDEP